MYSNKIELDNKVCSDDSINGAIARIKQVCIHYGMHEDWFPPDERGQHRLVRVVQQWGTLPQTISSSHVLALAHPDDKIVQRYPKEIRKKVNNDYPLLTNSFFVFTDGEEWWKGEPCFAVTNMSQYAQFCHYTMSKTDLEIREFALQSIKPVGRPATKMPTPLDMEKLQAKNDAKKLRQQEKEQVIADKIARKQEREAQRAHKAANLAAQRKQRLEDKVTQAHLKESAKQAHKLWLSQCAAHRAKIAELNAIYDCKFAEAEEARKAWRKLESDGAPPRPL